MQDAGHTPVAPVAGDGPSGGSHTPGTLIERYVFDPYGVLLEVTAGTGLWGSGGAASTGSSKIGHQGLFLDRLDADCLQPTMAAGRPGAAPNSSGTAGGNGTVAGGLAGGPSVGLYHNRNRTYAAHLGRFMQRDPNGGAIPVLESVSGVAAPRLGEADIREAYGDGMSLYQYLGGGVTHRHDPLGLWFGYDDLAVAFVGTVRGGLEEMIGQYVDNMMADFEWASDWDMDDDWHTRSDNSWVWMSFARGAWRGLMEQVDPTGWAEDHLVVAGTGRSVGKAGARAGLAVKSMRDLNRLTIHSSHAAAVAARRAEGASGLHSHHLFERQVSGPCRYGLKGDGPALNVEAGFHLSVIRKRFNDAYEAVGADPRSPVLTARQAEKVIRQVYRDAPSVRNQALKYLKGK